MRTDFLSPLFLSKQLGTFPAAYDQTLYANSYDYLNPNKTPMLVDQIRFTVNSAQLAAVRYGEIDVDLKLGSIPLTNGLTPITAFCPVYRNPFEFMFVWHLPKPMYVPRDVGLSATLYRRQADPNVAATTDMTSGYGPITLSLAARSIPMGWPVPKQVFMPWASATYVNTAISEWTSQDNELTNPHEENLILQQLVGFSAAGISTNRYSIVTVQATQSQNKVLMRDPTPMNVVFPPDRRFLSMSGVLAPKEFIRVGLKVNPPPNATTPDTSLAFTTIGMVGYRKMQTPWGAPAK